MIQNDLKEILSNIYNAPEQLAARSYSIHDFQSISS